MFTLLVFSLLFVSESQAVRPDKGHKYHRQGLLKDGETCYVGKDLIPLKPYCKGGQYSCVVDSVPGHANSSYLGKLKGHCNSHYAEGNYCQYQSIPFKVGTSGIVSKSTCVSCTCTAHPELPGKNKAQCDCDPLPPCFQDYNGKVVGKKCNPPETTCVLKKLNVKKTSSGLSVDQGTCHFPSYTQKPLCVSAGKGWGPKFYASGVKGIPMPGNRCMSCECVNGNFKNCKKRKNCTIP